MNITFVSDLHLEFGYQELPGGEVLILAGDICEARELKKCFHSTKPLDHTPGDYKFSDFFNVECAKYEKVFYVMGNHEHYHGRFDQTYDVIKSCLPANITLLENQVEEYRGVMFMGATLWTNCNNADSLTLYHIKHMMNDYKAIKNHYKEKDLYHKLVPEVTFRTHVKTLEWFKLMLSTHREKPFVVITHHAPSFMSVQENYKHDTIMNGAYASDLSEFILDNENIKTWVHGHMHEPVDYKIGETRVISNPRGYYPYEQSTVFQPGMYFEIENGSVS